MFRQREALIVAASASLILIIAVLYFIIRRRLRPNKVAETTLPLQLQPNPKRRLNYLFSDRGSSTKTLFNWADHPTLITDVVENGWSRFAFIEYNPSWTARSSMFRSLRATNDLTNKDFMQKPPNQVEETWEVGLGSVDIMQKLHFKINSPTASTTNPYKLTTRMNLPLPGPQIADSFPEEAYFEVTVISCLGNEGLVKSDSKNMEKAKLLSQQSDSAVISGIKYSGSVVQGSRKEGSMNNMKMSLGLSVGRSMVNKVPGSYPGSIGFHSNGSVYLAGTKLVFESEKEDWAQTGKVIGCGFDPKQKTVFFTLNSELVHIVHCKSQDFGTPLYPVIASNIDITVVVNLGQSNFSYAPANAHRTPNPCFTDPVKRSSPDALFEYYDDSRELFSMGRLDPGWLAHSATVRSSTISNNSHRHNNIRRTTEDDDELESELFEIVLDKS